MGVAGEPGPVGLASLPKILVGGGRLTVFMGFVGASYKNRRKSPYEAKPGEFETTSSF
jgi:hypothetical protein